MNKNTPVYIAIGAAALIGTGLYFFFKGKNSDDAPESENLPDDAQKEIVKKDLTFAESWYSTQADQLEADLQKVYLLNYPSIKDWYTEGFFAKNRILEIFKKLKTKSDWLKLVAKFDRRYSFKVDSFYKSNLLQWLNKYAGETNWKEKDAGGKDFNVNMLFMVRWWLRNGAGVNI